MKSLYRNTLLAAGVGLFVAAAACSHDMTPTGARGAVPASLSLAALPSTATTTASPVGLLSDDSDTGHTGMGGGPHGPIARTDVESLTVNVTKVEVLQEIPDSAQAKQDSADAVEDSLEKAHPDSNDAHEDSIEAKADTLRDEHGDHEDDERAWVSLDVTGGGHLNLLKLPDSASAGITFASGTLPAGTYKHVRLFVTDAMIFLKNQIVTPAGDTLKAGVGIPVIIPSRDSTGAAVKTDERFTVPSGGGTIKLFFDGDDTIRHIIVTGDGKIIVPPVIKG